MDTFLSILGFFVYSAVFVHAIPPEVCLARFRWDDCGKPPKPVMYYYKSGSRCEVGLWRGCLPNPNMFADEFECVSTCIFATRGSVNDAMNMLKFEDDVFDDMTPPAESFNETTVDSNSTAIEDGNATTVAGEPGAPAEGGETTAAGSDDNPAPADGETTAAADGAPAGEATTVARR